MARGARLLVLWLALALGGCVMFEQPPARLRCDPELAGRWVPLPDNPQDKIPPGAKGHVDIDGHCNVQVHETGKPRPRELRALGFKLDQQRYLAFDFKDLTSLLADPDSPAPLPQGLPERAVTLASYRFQGDVLEIATLDTSHAIEQIRAGKLEGREIDTGNFLFTGRRSELRSLLRQHPDLFQSFAAEDHPMRLRRARPGELP